MESGFTPSMAAVVGREPAALLKLLGWCAGWRWVEEACSSLGTRV